MAAVLPLVATIAAATGVAAFLAGERAERAHRASRVTYTRRTVERGRVFSARFSPDGKTIFYSAAWNGQHAACADERGNLVRPEMRPHR